VLEKAKKLNARGLKKLDSLHIACALATECRYFLTTDDEVLKLSNRIEEISKKAMALRGKKHRIV